MLCVPANRVSVNSYAITSAANTHTHIRKMYWHSSRKPTPPVKESLSTIFTRTGFFISSFRWSRTRLLASPVMMRRIRFATLARRSAVSRPTLRIVPATFCFDWFTRRSTVSTCGAC